MYADMIPYFRDYERAPPHRRRCRRAAERPGQLGARAHDGAAASPTSSSGTTSATARETVVSWVAEQEATTFRRHRPRISGVTGRRREQMPRGASRHPLSRASAAPVWRIKYRDAAGKTGAGDARARAAVDRAQGRARARQATRRGARGIPEARPHDVRRLRRPLHARLPARAGTSSRRRSRTTATCSTATCCRTSAQHDLTELEARPELIDGYVASKAERALAEDDPEPPAAPQRHASPRRRLAPDPHATRSRASTARASCSPR